MTERTQDTGYLQSINYCRHLFLDDDIVALYPMSLVFSASTLIKKNFLIYEETQKGAVAKSYMTNGLLIFD